MTNQTEKAGGSSLPVHRAFLLVLLGLGLYLAYLILNPFLQTIIMAIVLASLFFPLQMWLVRVYRGRKNLAALTVVLIIIFLILIPAVLFVSALVTQGIQVVTRTSDWLNRGGLQSLLESQQVLSYSDWLRLHLGPIKMESLNIENTLLQISKNLGQFLLTRGATLLGDMANMLFHFFVMVFVAFYFVRDGRDMVDQIKYLSPLREEQEDRILIKIQQVMKSVLFGALMTAIFQGIFGGIGMAIVGIPALFWGTVVAFASLIPIVGTALIWVPAAIYLVLTGHVNLGLFLVLWFTLVVGMIDNVARPFFMRGQGGLSPFYIFLAIIGGVKYFGLIGILYGPLILGFVMVVLYIYSVEYKDLLDGNHTLLIVEPSGAPAELGKADADKTEKLD